MLNFLKRFTAILLASFFVLSIIPAVNAEAAALKKPGNARFLKWNNKSFSDVSIAWNKVPDADCYEVKCTWTDNTHDAYSSIRYVDQYYNAVLIKNINHMHVYQAKVRACRMDAGGKVTSTGPWSNIVFITPWPRDVRGSVSSRSVLSLKWNIIYGSNGYNIFMSANPGSSWTWRYSTSTNASATSASFTGFKGVRFKRHHNYYVRVITRRKRNGVFCTVPEPYNSFYQFRFSGK